MSGSLTDYSIHGFGMDHSTPPGILERIESKLDLLLKSLDNVPDPSDDEPAEEPSNDPYGGLPH